MEILDIGSFGHLSHWEITVTDGREVGGQMLRLAWNNTKNQVMYQRQKWDALRLLKYFKKTFKNGDNSMYLSQIYASPQNIK